jgi:acetyl-CoA C-acetyltransferase
VMQRAGAMQVPGVRNALATAAGGSSQFFTVTVLGDEPRRRDPASHHSTLPGAPLKDPR